MDRGIYPSGAFFIMPVLADIEINRVFLQLYGMPKRYMVAYGGRRSGKSVAVSQMLVRKANENYRQIVVLRKYATTIRLSVWARILSAIEEIWELSLCQVNKTDRTITLPNGSTFYFVGADDPNKLKSIEGVTDYWLEEANEFLEEDFDTLDAGMSAEVDPLCQIWLTFNPIPAIPGYQHWLQRRFLNIEHELGDMAVSDDFVVLRTYYKHNAFCPVEVKRVLESYKVSNPSLYKMWGLGEFTTLEGVILTNYDIVTEIPEGANEIGYGMDFGFAHDPAAVIHVWGNKQEIWCQEVIYETGLTNPELSKIMEQRGIRKRTDQIIADSAEPKSIRELQNHGWIITRSEKGHDYKRAAAQYLRSLQIHILEGSANLMRECAMWSWKRDRQQNILPVPEDGNDHLVDALIYRVYKPKGFILV